MPVAIVTAASKGIGAAIARELSARGRALDAWVKIHAEAVAAKGVRVNAVLPGFVDSYPVDADIVAKIPMARPGSVGELAKVVAFLASPDASYVTGQCLLVDGGLV